MAINPRIIKTFNHLFIALPLCSGPAVGLRQAGAGV